MSWMLSNTVVTENSKVCKSCGLGLPSQPREGEGVQPPMAKKGHWLAPRELLGWNLRRLGSLEKIPDEGSDSLVRRKTSFNRTSA